MLERESDEMMSPDLAIPPKLPHRACVNVTIYCLFYEVNKLKQNRYNGFENPMALSKICVFVVYSVIVNCQSLPQFQNIGENRSNNSFIYYDKIHEGGGALKCVTNMSINCCHTNVSNWRDEFQEGADCLYVTRGDGVISLNRRNSDCIPPTSGLWRCDIPDSSGEIQSLYIYISNDTTSGKPNELHILLITSNQTQDD